MRIRRILVLAGAIAALCLIVVSTALAAGTSVSVRVEGLNRTLLPTKVVQTDSGSSITKGGTPAGTCPSTSGAGALDVATHHRFNGTYDSSFGLEITQILGETHVFSSPNYWSVWVDNRYAPTGVCGLKLHRGEQLLFAAVSGKGSPFPIVITAPRRATTGHPFAVKAYYYNAKAARKPLPGVSFKGTSGTTNKQGVVSLAAQRKGKLKLTGTLKGYIRSATATVSVS
jgi:hypothetical protein